MNSTVSKLLGKRIAESATAFKPERIDAWLNELQSGKRILVLTATGAELVRTREDVRQFYDQPHVALYVRPEIISANHGTEGGDKPQHPQQFSSGTSPESAPSSSQPASGSASSPAP
jgi:hypothetical protein